MLSTDKQTNKQTDRQTNQRYQKHNFLCQGGNNNLTSKQDTETDSLISEDFTLEVIF